jgi:hypothetical protein
MVPTYKRLYDDAKRKRGNKRYAEDKVEHVFNRGGLSKNMSTASLDSKGLLPYAMKKDDFEADVDSKEEVIPIYEARKYLKRVIVTFKGLKTEKLWK